MDSAKLLDLDNFEGVFDFVLVDRLGSRLTNRTQSPVLVKQNYVPDFAKLAR
jgi:hypothetical protein